MGCIQGGRGISQYPLASVSRIFLAININLQTIYYGKWPHGKICGSFSTSSMLRGLHVYSLKLPSVLNHLRKLLRWW